MVNANGRVRLVLRVHGRYSMCSSDSFGAIQHPVADMMVIFTLLGACPAEFSFERMASLIDNHNGWMERHGEEVRRGAEVTLSEEGRQPPE